MIRKLTEESSTLEEIAGKLRLMRETNSINSYVCSGLNI